MAPRASKRPAGASKRLTPANLEAMGAERLSALLLELSDSQPNLKRRLRMELAAEVGAADLAAEIDKRLLSLDASKARVSWRKRGDLIVDLHGLRRVIALRLGALDAPAAMARLLAFLDLSDGLTLRVKDPKGELDAVFTAVAEDLATLAETTPAPLTLAGPLADRLLRGRTVWAGWLGIALPALGPEFGKALQASLQVVMEARPAHRPAPQILRAVADAAGDPDAFIDTVPANLRVDPNTGAAIAGRLLAAGRVDEALKALAVSDPRNKGGRFGLGRGEADAPALGAWQEVYIDALEADGQTDAAQTERWAAFEQTLSPDPLRAYLKRLSDFDDVVAADRALDLAASHRKFGVALEFLMNWPALPEASAMILARRGEIDGEPEELVEWASRLEGRYPLAALLLVRAALVAALRDKTLQDQAEAWLHDAGSLASRISDLKGAESHDAFLAQLSARRGSAWRR